MHTNLQTFPTEIVQIIAKNLRRPDLSSLRLVCKRLYNQSFWIFSQLFSVIKTDLSAQSLLKLMAISNSEHLAPHVRTLHFRPNRRGFLGRGFKWCRTSGGVLADPPGGALVKASDPRARAVRNVSGVLADPDGGAVGTLQHILSDKFINCRSFQIDSYEDEWGFPREAFSLLPCDVMSLIYLIVFNANILVKSFVVQSKRESYGQLHTKRLGSPCLHLRMENQEEMVSWRTLESLILRFDMSVAQYDWALNLLKNAPALRSLCLDFRDDRTFFPRFVALGPFHALATLILVYITLNGKALSRFLSQHENTLRGLTLHHLRLAPDDGNKEAGTLWETVFGGMMGRMDRLERFSVLCLFETYNYVDRARVFFPSLSDDKSYPPVSGTEKRECRLAVGADARVGAPLEKPVQLIFKSYTLRGTNYGAAYEGRQMGNFLALLIKTKEVYSKRQ